MAEEEPSSLASIAKCQRLPAKEFEKQYKEHLSGFKQWDQKEHAEKWTVYPQNIGTQLSIDEVAVSKGELYTVVTNKAGHGGKGALVAMVAGIKSSDITAVLRKIPENRRHLVTEVTLDMSNAMDAITRSSFSQAEIVTDRFHVQQLVSEAVQEIRNTLRRAALQEENQAILLAKQEKRTYQPTIYANGDTKKQLLARSFYLLFKSPNYWTARQKERATILFKVFPELEHAYHLAMLFRGCYEQKQTVQQAKVRLDQWYVKVEEEQIDAFTVVAESIRVHEDTILNYFVHRHTNASAESFNAKLKGFRALVRGVRDIPFFLFRVGKIYG
jgi:transposase